jgi:hypothetical protein
LAQQVVRETFHLGNVAVAQFLDTPFQMSSAPMQSHTVEIHLGAATVQDDPMGSCRSI